jgi:hypothetical protein
VLCFVAFQLNRVDFVILLAPLDDVSVILIALAQMVLLLVICLYFWVYEI